MIKFFHLSFIACLLCLSNFVQAQDQQLVNLLEKLEQYNSDSPQERVHLHLDKPYYAASESIWFKGYITLGSFQHLSGLSKILYVDLFDPQDKLVQSLRLPVIAGVTMGDFVLADSLRAGIYRLQAYTQWMQNFDPSNYFEFKFPVLAVDLDLDGKESNQKLSRQKSSKSKQPEPTQHHSRIDFFPESGQMVAGNLTNVGFKAVSKSGAPMQAKGYIADEDGQKIVEFESGYRGMGSFSFFPTSGQSYFAYVSLAGEQEIRQKLPDVLPSGFNFMVNNEQDKKIFVQVMASLDQVKNQEMSLMFHRNADVFYLTKAKLISNELVFAIPKENLPLGVVQISLLSEDMTPVAERKIFNYDSRALLPLLVNASKPIYKPKEKVEIHLSVGEEQDESRIGVFSASVIDLEKVALDSTLEESHILASLLLNSDIKGRIEHADYYFQGDFKDKSRSLDQLMLTQGWSRLFWNQWQRNQLPEFNYPSEQSLKISGVITKRDRKTPVPHARVTLLTNSQGMSVLDTVSDGAGRFSFDELVFFDSTKFVIQAKDAKGDKNLEVVLDTLPKISHSALLASSLPIGDSIVISKPALLAYRQLKIQEQEADQKAGLLKKSIQIETVNIVEKATSEVFKHSSNLNGPGVADQTLTAEDLSYGCSTLQMCLQGRLTGVMFRDGVPYSTRSSNGQPMQIVMDGMYVDGEALSAIEPSDVETIEVLRSVGNTAVYGVQGSGGVLIVTTKRGDRAGIGRAFYKPGILTFTPKGYYLVREFYSPSYEGSDGVLAGFSDRRSTIHWAPNLISDEEGHVSFEFFAADVPGTYRVLIEGMDTQGRLARSIHYIQVK